MEGKKFNCETESEKEVPAEALATARHELGEHNGINMSIEASNTFTFKDSETMNRAFQGEVGPKTGIYIYSRHLNPTVQNLGRQIAAMEGTETGYCTASGKNHLVLCFFGSERCVIVTDLFVCRYVGDIISVAASLQQRWTCGGSEDPLRWKSRLANPFLTAEMQHNNNVCGHC